MNGNRFLDLQKHCAATYFTRPRWFVNVYILGIISYTSHSIVVSAMSHSEGNLQQIAG
jgi:hypothetical protein